MVHNQCQHKPGEEHGAPAPSRCIILLLGSSCRFLGRVIGHALLMSVLYTCSNTMKLSLHLVTLYPSTRGVHV